MVPGGAAVLRVLLVLRVEVVNSVCHDVPATIHKNTGTLPISTKQGCGSESAWIRINLVAESESGSRRAKMNYKYRKM